METLDKIRHSFEGLTENLSYAFSDVIPGLLLIITSFIAAYLIGFTVRIFTHIIRLDNWFERTGFIKVLHKMGVKSKANVLMGKVFFWLTFLILLEAIANVHEWASISGKFNQFISFIPLLIGGIIIIMFGLFISRFIRKTVSTILSNSGSSAASLLGNISFYTLMIITITIALSQIGVNTAIITANISIILGILLFSFSLSFVFASRNLLTNILASSYNKKNYQVGQIVSVFGNEGEIIKITNLSVYIRSTKKIYVIPAHKFTEEVVEIHG